MVLLYYLSEESMAIIDQHLEEVRTTRDTHKLPAAQPDRRSRGSPISFHHSTGHDPPRRFYHPITVAAMQPLACCADVGTYRAYVDC